MFNVQKGVMVGSWLMGRKNNSGTLVGPSCGMVNGGKRTQSYSMDTTEGS